MPADADDPQTLCAPLFPLPNVVLFPHAVLPLHIFEERYKRMTADALAGPQRVTLALLKPGWEREYHNRPAIEPVVCLGQIISHEKLPDGKYNFLLRGLLRARVMREVGDQPYRLAELQPLAENDPPEEELTSCRAQLLEFFSLPALQATSLGGQFVQKLSEPTPLAPLADLIAFTFLDDVALKQSLLAELDISRRIGRLLRALDKLVPLLQSRTPVISRKPSLN